MGALVITIHVLACLFLIVLVLLQSGKEGMGVIFGGGSTSVFGSTGAGGLLVKLTAISAVVFLITSLTYNKIVSHKAALSDSIMGDQPAATAPAPAAPAAPAPVAPATPAPAEQPKQ